MMLSHKTATVENIESLSAQELVDKIKEVCDNNGIDMNDTFISVGYGDLEIQSKTLYYT